MTVLVTGRWTLQLGGLVLGSAKDRAFEDISEWRFVVVGVLKEGRFIQDTKSARLVGSCPHEIGLVLPSVLFISELSECESYKFHCHDRRTCSCIGLNLAPRAAGRFIYPIDAGDNAFDVSAHSRTSTTKPLRENIVTEPVSRPNCMTS